MKEFGWYQGNQLGVIPLADSDQWCGALWMSWLVSKSEKTRWLLP